MYFLTREKVPKSARGDRIRIDDCHPGPPQLTPQLCLYADFALYCLAGAFRYALKLPSARCGFAQFCASAATHHLLTDSKGEDVFQPRRNAVQGSDAATCIFIRSCWNAPARLDKAKTALV